MAAGGGRWPCGREATLALAAMLQGAETTCVHKPGERDLWNRMIGVCAAGGVEINAEMVRRGLAWSFRKYSHDYDATEEDARARGVGIWQASGHQTPWDYRHNAWEDALRDAPTGRPIKSTVTRKGECIYHTPWSRWYRDVDMNKGRNRRWFATEGEAMDARCRPPMYIYRSGKH